MAWELQFVWSARQASARKCLIALGLRRMVRICVALAGLDVLTRDISRLEKTMQLVLATKAGKLPVVDRVREKLIEHVLPILLEDKEQFYQGNGENLTIGQDSFFTNITNDDGSSAGRVMLSWSPNIWGPKVEGAAKAKKNGASDDDRITLVPKEMAALDAAIATMKQANDIDNAVKLATIKSVASQQGGKVSRNDYRVVFSLLPSE